MRNHILAAPNLLWPICGLIAETRRFVSEPILSHRLAHVAISCIQYLFHCGANAQDHLLAWAMKSKRSPWSWRRRMRVTSTRRRPDKFTRAYSFSQSLRRVRQKLYSEKIQSEKFYGVQRTIYIWTCNLLYLTLCISRKSEELTRALSKSAIPLSASLLFPRRIKRVRKAIDTYLDKVSQTTCSNLRSDDLGPDVSLSFRQFGPSSTKTFGRPRVEGFRIIR
jgi:hypothetical protein